MTSIRLAFNSSLWKPSFADWMLAGQIIQSEERKRISEFYFINDVKLSLAARLLLRYAVIEITGKAWNEFKLLRDSNNKPYLDNASQFFLNASHDGELSVVAADSNCLVGVDVMNNTRNQGDVQQFFKLMKSKFSKHEWQHIFSYNDEVKQMKAFYRNWCLKESYVKAIGTGINYPLEKLNFTSPTSLTLNTTVYDTTLEIDNVLTNEWLFEENLLDEQHCVAVARNSSNYQNISGFRFVKFEEIVERSRVLCSKEQLGENFLNSWKKPEKHLNKFYHVTS